MCFLGNYKKLAFHMDNNKIGNLEWNIVKEMLEEVFKYTEIDEIMVCEE